MKMNKRRVFSLVGIICMALIFTGPSPANAIFGLSTCEKVKKQILKYEKIDKPLAKKWEPYQGLLVWNVSQPELDQLLKNWKTLVDLEVKMYGLEINNLKCFTNTQSIYIKRVYPIWKAEQLKIRFNPNNYNFASKAGVITSISWDSIYNQ